MNVKSICTSRYLFKQALLDFAPRFSIAAIALALSASVLTAVPAVLAKQQLASASVGQQSVGEQVIGKRSYSTSTMIINASVENCYEILTDYRDAAKVFPTLKKCQVIEDHGATKLINYVTRPSGSFTDYSYVLEVKETPNQMIEWKRVSGDFKAIDGYWKLQPVQGGAKTQITYATYVDGGLFMPQVLIKRQFRIDLPPCMAALKTHAESTTTRVAAKTGANTQ